MHAVTDVSVMSNQVGAHWEIVNFVNHTVKIKEIFDKEWSVSSPKEADASIMLDILEFVKDSTTPQLEG